MELLKSKLAEMLASGILLLPRIVLALFVLVLGLWVIRIAVKTIRKALTFREIEPTIQRFLVSLMDVVLKIMLVLTVASMLGIETTSFLAILGSAGLAVGLALQGGLTNFAGGVLILIFKPFKVGDWVDAQGIFGQVEEISILVTTIITNENKTVIIPNGPLANGIITNYTTKGYVRLDLSANIAAHVDVDKGLNTILNALQNTKSIVQTPAPSAHVCELGDNYTKIQFYVYAHPDNYWDAYYSAYENVRKALQKDGVMGPFPLEVQVDYKDWVK